MTPEARIAVLRRGVAVLRAVEAARRAALPPPDHDHLAAALAVREVMGLADRVEPHLDIEVMGTDDPGAVFAFQDAVLSTVSSAGDDALLASLETEVSGQDELRALREFRALLARYATDEFRPPNT